MMGSTSTTFRFRRRATIAALLITVTAPLLAISPAGAARDTNVYFIAWGSSGYGSAAGNSDTWEATSAGTTVTDGLVQGAGTLRVAVDLTEPLAGRDRGINFNFPVTLLNPEASPIQITLNIFDKKGNLLQQVVRSCAPFVEDPRSDCRSGEPGATLAFPKKAVRLQVVLSADSAFQINNGGGGFSGPL
jgi:hypothetical protein